MFELTLNEIVRGKVKKLTRPL